MMNDQGHNWGPNWGPNRALSDSNSVTTEELLVNRLGLLYSLLSNCHLGPC